jgi:hypothetical protein
MTQAGRIELNKREWKLLEIACQFTASRASGWYRGIAFSLLLFPCTLMLFSCVLGLFGGDAQGHDGVWEDFLLWVCLTGLGLSAWHADRWKDDTSSLIRKLATASSQQPPPNSPEPYPQLSGCGAAPRSSAP